MHTIQIRYRVGSEGILRLELPVDIKEADLDVLVVYQTVSSNSHARPSEWPSDFFERFAGAFADDPIERADQGEE